MRRLGGGEMFFASHSEQGERVRCRVHAAFRQQSLAEFSLLSQFPLYPLISTALARSAAARTMSCVIAYSRPSAPDGPIRAIRRATPRASRSDRAVARAALESPPSFAWRQPRPARDGLPRLYPRVFVPYRSSRQNAPEPHHHARCPDIYSTRFEMSPYFFSGKMAH